MDCRYPVIAGFVGRDPKPVGYGQLGQIRIFIAHPFAQSHHIEASRLPLLTLYPGTHVTNPE